MNTANSTASCRRRARLWLMAVLLLLLPAGAAVAADSGPAGPVVLDRVVAVVGEQAVMASEVEQEMRFAAFAPNAEPATDNTPQRALQRLIDRLLIDEQRSLQPGAAEPTQQQVDAAISAMRASIPACAHYQCSTAAGWQRFVTDHGFTQQEVEARVRDELAILKFIDMRFSVAARVPASAVQQYFNDVLRPQLIQRHAAVPQLAQVAARIRDILRQQQISAMLDQWLKGLRAEDHVRILDPAYRQVVVQGEAQ